MKILSQRIKKLRKEYGYTQTQLASVLGVSRGAIANWESGIRVPDSGTVANLATVFRVSVDYLLGTSQTHKSLSDAKIDVSMLNEKGLEMVREYCRYLSFFDKYTSK